MGTRCGTLDPACVEFIANTENKTVSDVLNMMNKKSGLLGLTGSSDMRDVTKRMDEGDENAKLAIEMWTYTVQKYIGSYIAAMNGCDAIIFTAGIGENHIRARKWVCEGLSYFGIKIDDERNDVAGEERMISTDDSAGFRFGSFRPTKSLQSRVTRSRSPRKNNFTKFAKSGIML